MDLELELRHHSWNSTNSAKFQYVLSCPCHGDGYFENFGFLEIWVAYEFGRVNGAPHTWAETKYFGHKILMKSSHDCSY